MTNIWKAVLFGIVEGITEWLPVSSTGHMILLEKLTPFSGVSAGFMEMFLVVVQLGAIMAVVLMYWDRLLPFDLKKKGHIRPDVWILWMKIIVACIPAVLVELWLGNRIEQMFYRYEVVAGMLIVFGIWFILVERYNKGREDTICEVSAIPFRYAFMIGIFQVIAAVFPGTSRSGATILGALLIGIARNAAAEFTFFLAVPVMFGASFLKLLQYGMQFTRQELAILLVGMVIAFLVSVVIIKGLMEYIKKNDFTVFGYYRIALGMLVVIVYPMLL